jgi:DNA-binding NarL/FixJ family response regulator
METAPVVTALIVEDNPSFRLSLTEILRARFPGMTVTEAESSEQALERIGSLRPDLMFVDIRLPGQNGLELAKQVRKTHEDLAILIMTNYDFPEFREAAEQYGVNYFFSKSTSSMEEILAAVNAILGGKGEPRQREEQALPR